MCILLLKVSLCIAGKGINRYETQFNVALSVDTETLCVCVRECVYHLEALQNDTEGRCVG